MARWFRYGLSVAGSFVCRCLNSCTVLRFHTPARQTGRADFPHPAFGQELMRSPTERCGHTSGVEPAPGFPCRYSSGKREYPRLCTLCLQQPLTDPFPGMPSVRPTIAHEQKRQSGDPFALARNASCSFRTFTGVARLTSISWLIQPVYQRPR